MLIVDVKQSDSLDRALKKYKKKFEKAGILRELRDRQGYTKLSVKKRTQVLKAVYRNHLLLGQEE